MNQNVIRGSPKKKFTVKGRIWLIADGFRTIGSGVWMISDLFVKKRFYGVSARKKGLMRCGQVWRRVKFL